MKFWVHYFSSTHKPHATRCQCVNRRTEAGGIHWPTFFLTSTWISENCTYYVTTTASITKGYSPPLLRIDVMSRPAPISTNLRQKLSSLTSPVAPSFSSSTATFSTSLGPAKKRGILGSWLRGKGPDHAVYPDPKGKERQWDAGELDEEMQRIMNSVIFNGGLDYECVLLRLDPSRAGSQY